MIKSLLRKLFGTKNDRLLKEYQILVNKINQLEPIIKKLTDLELKEKTQTFRSELNTKTKTLDDILPEAFAVCREASSRVLGMRHFDVQLLGGIVLHKCKIAEMRTGEGKTLVATLVVYLRALSGMGVHLVTVNDYLAKRDALEMGKLYNFLGLSVGINLPNLSYIDKKLAYNSDITYGTNNEFVFDYLRDNMVYNAEEKVQRPFYFAVIDEVDSILIDEARTPCIISGQADVSNELYNKLNALPMQLKQQLEEDTLEGDFWVDEKHRNIVLSELGHENVEALLIKNGLLQDVDSLYSKHNISLMHHLMAALKAHYLYLKDRDYVVQNNEIIIVDEFTGRLMHGRRWSDGLHQAVEAKEGVQIQHENQTLASITFQNYFRLYAGLSGMTGTADTEAFEFQHIYNLETVVIPTNRPMIRLDYNDKIYLTLEDKYKAIVNDIKECNQKGQPVLIGTTSVESSEFLSDLLKKANLKHEVLNAKYHEKEAFIISQAGSLGAITVATNMAGRGTDIILGGNYKTKLEEINSNLNLTEADKKLQIDTLMANWMQKNTAVKSAGGLYIIGTERHESRRIDNQLRGRSGRQGDAGASRFYLSLDDSLLRIFGGEKMRKMMLTLGMSSGESIEHKWLSRSIETAQRKVESHNFDIRKQLLEYDNVANDQRLVIYEQRDLILTLNNLSNIINKMITDVSQMIINNLLSYEDLDISNLKLESIIKLLQEEYNITNIQLAHLNAFLQQDTQKINNNTEVIVKNLSKELTKDLQEHYANKILYFKQLYNQHITKFIDALLVDDYQKWNLVQLRQFMQDNLVPCNENVFDAYIQDRGISVENLNNMNEIEKQEFKINFKEYLLSLIADISVEHNLLKFERNILLQFIDSSWKEHLNSLDYLREGIHLRGYAQKDPKREYQREAFLLFEKLLNDIKHNVVKTLLSVKVEIVSEPQNNIEVQNTNTAQEKSSSQVLSRNSLCFCGSNKKYKHCHGRFV